MVIPLKSSLKFADFSPNVKFAKVCWKVRDVIECRLFTSPS